jgi:hypothetical protein
MVIISKTDWPGTKQELLDRIAAFAAACEAHKLTVGEPAPREIDLVETLYGSGAEFDVYTEPPPAPPPPPLTARQIVEKNILDIEIANPITHRGLREFVLAVASKFPEAAGLPGVQRVKVADDQIKLLRAQL